MGRCKTKTCLVIIFLLFICLQGCLAPVGHISHYYNAINHFNNNQYDKSITEYQATLDEIHKNPNRPYDYKTIEFSSYLDIATCYLYMGDYDRAYEHYNKALYSWPQLGHHALLGLATIEYIKSNFDAAIGYIDKAYASVATENFKAYEKSSPYKAGSIKNRISGMRSYLKLSVNYDKLKNSLDLNKFDHAANIANSILNEKYLVDFGVDCGSTYVDFVRPGSIADINGILKGDQIISINNQPTENISSINNVLSNLYDKCGYTVDIKIIRNNREMNIACRLYYPELEQTKKILTGLEKGSFQKISKNKKVLPKIVILEPKPKRGLKLIGNRQVNFSILASNIYEIKKVYVNNVLCSEEPTSYLEKNILDGFVKKFTAKISISDKNQTYIVKAIDSKGNISTKTIDVAYSDEQPKDEYYLYEKRVAVVIGIDKYNVWPRLECAVADAEAVKAKFTKMGFDKIFELTNSDATRINILRLLSDKIPGMLGENDQLVVYFAGHGQTETYKDKDGLVVQEGYIIPIDGDTKNYSGTAISMSKIIDVSNRIKAKHVFYAFDSCYSGLGLKRSGGVNKTDDYVKKISSLKSVQIITAGGKDEQASEEKGHGVFTRYFLQALDGKLGATSTEYVTGSEIGTFIRPVVSKQTKNAQTPNFGWLLGEGDNIFFNASNK